MNEKREISYRVCPTVMGTWRNGIGIVCLVLAAAVVSPAQGDQPSPDAVTFKTLVSFNPTTGANPDSQLVQGFDGHLYGTTAVAGDNGGGNFFELLPNGSVKVLYSFCAQVNCADGNTTDWLVLGADGNFYGTTLGGGNATGFGTVFRMTPAGNLTTLYQFCSLPNCTDGAGPNGLTLGIDGNFYGTTGLGGSNPACQVNLGCGTIFKVTPHGQLTTVYNFDTFTLVPVIQATDGNFYGTNQGGGSGLGSIYKVTPAGAFSTFYSFCMANCADGQRPDAPLVQGSDGALYGAAQGGGGNETVVFKITLAGAFTLLHTLCSQPSCTDGTGINAGLIQGSDGSVYGTTTFGGTSANCNYFGLPGCGTIFRVTPSGKFTTLHEFNGIDGGEAIQTVLMMQRTDGTFFGASTFGGINDPLCANGSCGTLYSLSIGLGPFIALVERSGKVGDTVQILGNNLTGATSVSFNGVAATFTVVSATEITTTVPTGATTGKVEVVTATRTLKSNVRFQVRP